MSDAPCPSSGGAQPGGACDGGVRLAFDLLGKRWNGLIVATLSTRPTGFADLRRAIDGISDSVLSDRLSELTAANLVLRRVEPGPPVAVAYELSDAGRALLPVLDSLASWAGDHLRPPARS